MSSSKPLTIAGEDDGREEASFTLGRSVSYYVATVETSVETKSARTKNTAIPLLGIWRKVHLSATEMSGLAYSLSRYSQQPGNGSSLDGHQQVDE